MTGVMTLYRTSIGKKAIMAATGLLLVGFVFIHMWGNLKVYAGPEAINQYAVDLRYLGEPIFGYAQALWLARLVLLGAVGLHIWAAVSLTLQSRRSRAQGYAEKRGTQPAYTYASYTMRWGGVVILLFIIYHLMHFTFGAVGYAPNQFMHPEGGEYFVYQNLVAGFQFWPSSLFYMAAMLALGLHMFHGIWSMMQTLGLNNKNWTHIWRGVAALVALAVVIGNISIPIAVLAGIIQ